MTFFFCLQLYRQAQPKFCDAGVQCNIGHGRHQRESTPDILEEEHAVTEEETDSNDENMSFTEALSSSLPDSPE